MLKESRQPVVAWFFFASNCEDLNPQRLLSTSKVVRKKFAWLFITRSLVFVLASISALVSLAEDRYQEPADFISESFGGAPPKSSVLWITKEIKPAIYEIMGHDLDLLRIRYWNQNSKTVWILDEIGKKHPITVGFIVEQDKLQQVKVLIFRESRGSEVRHAFFTDQFQQLGLTPENKLDQGIDGISGATLSVRALKKLAGLALFFHKQIEGELQ